MPKQIEGMPLSFKRRIAANHALLKTGFSRSTPVHRTNPEGQLRVDLTRSPHRLARTAICAHRTADVDVKRRLRIATVGCSRGKAAIRGAGLNGVRGTGWPSFAPSTYSGNPSMRPPSARLSATACATPTSKSKRSRNPGSRSSSRRTIGCASSWRPASASDAALKEIRHAAGSEGLACTALAECEAASS